MFLYLQTRLSGFRKASFFFFLLSLYSFSIATLFLGTWTATARPLCLTAFTLASKNLFFISLTSLSRIFAFLSFACWSFLRTLSRLAAFSGLTFNSLSLNLLAGWCSLSSASSSSSTLNKAVTMLTLFYVGNFLTSYYFSLPFTFRRITPLAV